MTTNQNDILVEAINKLEERANNPISYTQEELRAAAREVFAAGNALPLHSAYTRVYAEGMTTKQEIEVLEVLELAAKTECLLNLYMAAVGVDASKFPIVEAVRAQVRAVRNSIGSGIA